MITISAQDLAGQVHPSLLSDTLKRNETWVLAHEKEVHNKVQQLLDNVLTVCAVQTASDDQVGRNYVLESPKGLHMHTM